MKKQVHFQILRKASPTVKRSALRFIFAKSIYRPKELEKYDIILMNELYLSLADDLVRNASFYDKYKLFFSNAVKRIKFINDLYETSFVEKLSTRKHYFVESDHDYSDPLSPRAFRGLESDAAFQRQYSRLLKLGREDLIRIDERYIGVGYKDKGARRDPAKDGSPAWQEVAMARKLLMKNSDWNKLHREYEVNRTISPSVQSNEDCQQPEPTAGYAARILDFVEEANAPITYLKRLAYDGVAANDDLYIASLD